MVACRKTPDIRSRFGVLADPRVFERIHRGWLPLLATSANPSKLKPWSECPNLWQRDVALSKP
jgi:hypothetical protein